MSEYPIVPPLELVKQWLAEKPDTELAHIYLATKAARWGADRQLEMCKEWLKDHVSDLIIDMLHDAMRPKSPSLAEEAIAELDGIMDELHEATDSAFTASTIRAALKRLQELENNG